nr:DUF4158 domain-containing protein [Cupriavidus necator]
MTELVRISAGLSPGTRVGYDRKVSPTLFRHYTAVREFLGIQTYIGTDANEITVRAARDAAETMDQPVDIINATIDALVLRQIELPAFSTLDAIAEQVHARTQTALFRRVARRLSQEEQHRLDRLLTREFRSTSAAIHSRCRASFFNTTAKAARSVHDWLVDSHFSPSARRSMTERCARKCRHSSGK